MAHPDLALLAPWLAGVRVALGHADHTPHSQRVLAALRAFYRTGTGLGRPELEGVTHVAFGPREERLRGRSAAYDPGADPRLELVGQHGPVRLFAVRGP